MSAKQEDTCCASSKLNLKVLLEQPLVAPGPDIVATMVHLDFPPGDIGSPPHFHSGPVVGYVLEGEFLFQVNKEPHRILKAGMAFHEKDRDTHVWGGNASDTKACKVIATVFGRPGEAVTTYLENYPRESRQEALALAAKGL